MYPSEHDPGAPPDAPESAAPAQDASPQDAQAQDAPAPGGAGSGEPGAAVHGAEGEPSPTARADGAVPSSVRDSGTPACVAVVETAYVGDVVMSSVIARSLRRAWPGSEILLVARPGPAKMAAGLGFHAAVEFDKRGKHAGLVGIDRLVRRLRKRGVEVLIVPHRSARSALLAWRSKFPVRVGFAGDLQGIPFSARLKRYAFEHQIPYDRASTFTKRLASLLEPLDVPVTEQAPRYRPSVEAKSSVSDLLICADAGRSKLAALVPGSVWPTKRWPEARFARLADLLFEQGMRSVVLGSEDERPLLQRMRRHTARPELLIDGVGTSLDQAAELMRRAEVVVAGDTGLLHLGQAVGTKAVALFGPTDPAQHSFPKGGVLVITVELSCRPCSTHGQEACPERHHRCMRDLTPEQVGEAVAKLLRPRRRRRKVKRDQPAPNDAGAGPQAEPATGEALAADAPPGESPQGGPPHEPDPVR